MQLRNKEPNIYRRLTILIGLLVLCIVQTGLLWLGDPTSLSFFAKEKTATLSPFLPEKIWLSTGAPYPLGYGIHDGTREHKRLVTELSSVLAEVIAVANIEEMETIAWNELLSRRGLVYEYIGDIGIEEITGTRISTPAITDIDTVYAYLQDAGATELVISLLNTAEDRGYQLVAKGDFLEVKKIMDAFSSQELLENWTKYQPSSGVINMNQFINGNVFLPLTGTDNPVVYDKIMLHDPIIGSNKEKVAILEESINGFFVNPLLKNVEYTEEGGFLFTESMRAIVLYKPQGTLEYINLGATGQSSSKATSKLEGYNIALELASRITSNSLGSEEKLYLSEIKASRTGYMYCFDSRYNGYKVNWGANLKEQLGLDHKICIQVENGTVVQARWSVLELMPYTRNGLGVQGALYTEYMEPINTIYSQAADYAGEIALLDNIEQVYFIQDREESVQMRWAVQQGKVWYYP